VKTEITLVDFANHYREDAARFGFNPLEHKDNDKIYEWISFNVVDIIIECALAGDSLHEKLLPVTEAYEHGDKQLVDLILCGIVPSLGMRFERDSLKNLREKAKSELPKNLHAIWDHWAEMPSW